MLKSPSAGTSGDAGAVIAVCGMAFEASIAAGGGVEVLCGVGSERLIQRLEALLAHGARRYRGVISFGTAGGLDPALAPGACVIADQIVTATGRFATDPDWLKALQGRLPHACVGALAGVDQPLADVAGKTLLWRNSAALAVDMESHRAATVALRHGLPFAACRVVVDPAHRSLPSSATVGLRDDGSTAIMPILRVLARHPGQLPALIQLAGDAGRAKATLSKVRVCLEPAFAIPLDD